MFDIRLVDPREDPEIVEKAMSGQAQAYACSGLECAVDAQPWEEIAAGSVHFVVAQDQRTGELAGGIRLCVRKSDQKLPIELLLEANEPLGGGAYESVRREIKRWTARGLVQSSGLWVLPPWRRTDLGMAMFRVAIAAMPLLGARRAIAFAPHHTTSTWLRLGWSIDAEAGPVLYPDERYISCVLWLDPVALDRAERRHRDIILHLRRNLRSISRVRWEPYVHGRVELTTESFGPDHSLRSGPNDPAERAAVKTVERLIEDGSTMQADEVTSKARRIAATST